MLDLPHTGVAQFGATQNEKDDMSISQGDVVKLKSGGPLMTVSIINGEEVYCEWFDSQGKYMSQAFRAVVLVLVNQ